jgi:hypothetical protein
MQNLDTGLSSVVERVPGLRVVVVSGGDGIPLLKYPHDPPQTDGSTIGTLESAFAIAADQVFYILYILISLEQHELLNT